MKIGETFRLAESRTTSYLLGFLNFLLGGITALFSGILLSAGLRIVIIQQTQHGVMSLAGWIRMSLELTPVTSLAVSGACMFFSGWIIFRRFLWRSTNGRWLVARRLQLASIICDAAFLASMARIWGAGSPRAEVVLFLFLGMVLLLLSSCTYWFLSRPSIKEAFGVKPKA